MSTIAIFWREVDGETGEARHVELVVTEDQVTFDDLLLTGLVEYRFADEMVWRLSGVGVETVATIRENTFAAWKAMLDAPDCEAQFRRLLQCGIVVNVYDHVLFPTPEYLTDKYSVVDEKNGKTIALPHQVDSLRVWNAPTQSYTTIDPHLAGAPNAEEKDDVWAGILHALKEKHSAEYIGSLLARGAELVEHKSRD